MQFVGLALGLAAGGTAGAGVYPWPFAVPGRYRRRMRLGPCVQMEMNLTGVSRP
jgi:hypothetical protein